MNENPPEKETFNLLQELQKDNLYDRLIPNRELGLLILSLHQQHRLGIFPDNIMTEESVLQTLIMVRPDFKNERREDNNRILQDAQEFFLVRDEKGLYRLKDYAFQFAQLIEEKVQKEFSPTVMKRIFDQLDGSIFDLVQRIQKGESGAIFQSWFEDHFQHYRHQISVQIQTLDGQVSRALHTLQENLRQNHEGELSFAFYERINQSLDVFKSQSAQLRDIFQGADEIRTHLAPLSFTPEQNLLAPLQKEILAFLRSERYNVAVIDKRLDRIKPRIQSIFGDLNKNENRRRIERFLNYLLQHSQPDGRNSISFPPAIETKYIHHHTLCFFFPDRMDPPRIEAQTPRKSVPDEQKMLEHKQKKALERLKKKSIEGWISQFERELAEKMEFSVDRYFFQMLKADMPVNWSLTVCNRIIRKFNLHPIFHIVIDRRIAVRHHQFPRSTLWKTTIHRKVATTF